MSHLDAVKLEPSDRAAIEALITEFFELTDRGPTDRLSELFIADATLAALDIGIDLRGNRVIADYFAARTAQGDFRSRHSWTSLRVLEVEANEVRTSIIVIVYMGRRLDGTPKDFSVGNCEDLIRRQPDGTWLFASRHQVKVIT